ncbi:MAG: hypothetical protein A3I71_03480 [Omnitrophica WOR_2 bacterium RIFCSPLOWO2_02_FULL_63_16]|nr:MAG: hypothetical protein A2Z92_00260 [Omnitrophica WOR_2 bacterium GWA2_63_20]OGX45096.1 MAG: hypothetical protein A3I71_03480 [Omnitrophica WOR_2 bacterium RIFCSPLOWO2_02_FULL_63_16]
MRMPEMAPSNSKLHASTYGITIWAVVLALVGGFSILDAEETVDWAAVIERLGQEAGSTPFDENRRKQLAIAHNNYAIRLAEGGEFSPAEQHLQEAIRLEPADAKFQENLAGIYLQRAQVAYQQHRMTEAREAITKALKLNSQEISAYVLLGEVEYHSQRLKEARHAWQQAIALDPARADVTTRLEQLDQELPVESNFERLSQAYFDIRYTEDLARSEGFDIRDDLLEARRTVGADFQFWPKHKLIVLLYQTEQFRSLRAGTPDWLAGQYDGKVRVPLPGQGLDQAGVRRTLIHEYTHAVVHDLTKGALPIWFNEGLAEYEAWKGQAPPWRTLKQAAVKEQLMPWSRLSTGFSMSLPAEEVALAYEQSHSIVRYLVERYGFWRIRRLLKALVGGLPIEEAMTKEFRQKPARLETEWRTWLTNLLAQSSP